MNKEYDAAINQGGYHLPTLWAKLILFETTDNTLKKEIVMHDPVISVSECNSGCKNTLVAHGCTCPGTPSAIIVNADTVACSIQPLNFTYDPNTKTYDLYFFNNTIDIDQECMVRS
ncbi:hypothetical protein CHS0354_028685 [Potamilus streckersoni]|uniref:Uncharacterized protein n=1 Tax=Potamilus streckersoni TaxID=2493646 RepID=A0AAE0SWF7_9BIVA|nr:hypothetical protein CHS0354_028685 [Potamilus streckersoni]